jgi:hypothetical protein
MIKAYKISVKRTDLELKGDDAIIKEYTSISLDEALHVASFGEYSKLLENKCIIEIKMITLVEDVNRKV